MIKTIFAVHIIFSTFLIMGCGQSVTKATCSNTSEMIDTTNLNPSLALLQDDFESGWNSTHSRGSNKNRSSSAPAWRFSQMQSDQAGQVITDPQNRQNQVMQFLWQKDLGKNYDANTQVKAHLYGPFGKDAKQEELWSFDVYFPSEDMKSDSESEIIIQWHGVPDDCETSRNPPIALDNKEDQLTLTWRYDNAQCTPLGFNQWDAVSRSLGETPKDEWVNFKFHIKFDPEGCGFIKVWKNDLLKIEEYNIPIGFNDQQGAYLGFGIYKFTGKSDLTQRRIYFDNIKLFKP